MNGEHDFAAIAQSAGEFVLVEPVMPLGDVLGKIFHHRAVPKRRHAMSASLAQDDVPGAGVIHGTPHHAIKEKLRLARAAPAVEHEARLGGVGEEG